VNKRHFIPLVLLTSLGAIIPQSAAVAGQAPCTKADLNGPYGFTFQGTVHLPNELVYTAISGIIEFDGRGNLYSRRTISINGAITTDSVTGTYTANRNCTGSATLSDGLTFSAVAGKREPYKIQELLFIGTNAGYVVTGVAKKQ